MEFDFVFLILSKKKKKKNLSLNKKGSWKIISLEKKKKMIINTLNSSLGKSNRVQLELGDSFQDFVMKIATQEEFDVDRTVVLWGGRELDEESYLDLAENEVVEVVEEAMEHTPTSVNEYSNLIPHQQDDTLSNSSIGHHQRSGHYLRLTTAICFAVTSQITSSSGPFLITKLDLFSSRYTAVVTMPLIGWSAAIFIAVAMVSLAILNLELITYNCRLFGITSSVLMLVMNVLTLIFPTSEAVLLTSAGAFGFSFCTSWSTSGCYSEHLLRGTPGWSLGFSSGLISFLLHSSTYMLSVFSYNIDRHVIDGILITLSVLAAVIFFMIPSDDKVAMYYPSISVLSSSVIQNFQTAGLAKMYIFSIFYHGMLCQQLWVGIPSRHSLHRYVSVSSGTGAAASLVMGVLVSFSSPLITIGISTSSALTGIVLINSFRNPSEDVLWICTILLAAGSAGYQIQTYCILQRLSQQYLVGTQHLYGLWLVVGGFGFLGSCFLFGGDPTGGIGPSKISIAITYSVGSVISVISCAISAKTMSTGRGWHHTLPRMSSINIEETKIDPTLSSKPPDPDVVFDGGDRQRATSDLWHRFANFIGTPGREQSFN